MSYRVDLPVFSGPMDLLLHLIKQREVDIHEIPIAGVLSDYLQHLAVLQALDLADIGDFVVMASTLMELKSRELLPKEEVVLEEELDPRDDLIRQLLDYKRYRDLSRRLDRLARRRARQVPVHAPLQPGSGLPSEPEAEDLLDLGDIDVWTLTAAFARLLEETGQDTVLHFGIERRDVRYYAARVLERVKQAGEVRFEALFDRGEGRAGLIGVFTAMLELLKQGYLRAHQDQCFAEIVVRYVGDPDATVDDMLPAEISFASAPAVTPPAPESN